MEDLNLAVAIRIDPTDRQIFQLYSILRHITGSGRDFLMGGGGGLGGEGEREKERPGMGWY